MIILTEVAKKIQDILNGTDSETSHLSNPTDFEFVVNTEGFHIDSIASAENKRNFIPVFISSMGGQFNPVKGLKQGSYSIPIVFYYPVRFKDNFFALGDFLVDVFVGTILNYGTVSGKAVSNISVPQFGEIQDLDFVQFKKWVSDTYSRPIDYNELYLTMNITLYLSNAASGLIYGNDIKTSFSFTYGETTYTDEEVRFDSASIQSNSQTQSEQEEGTNEADSIPFGTSYASSFKLFPNLETKATESTNETPIYFYKELLKIWLNGNIQAVRCKIKFKIANDDDLVYERDCFIQSITAPIEIGQLFSITLSFSKVASEA